MTAGKDEDGDRGLRRCIVTGERHPRAGMIRFVVGPDDALVPDLAARLPGRGLWMVAGRDMLEKALEKNLFSKAARAKVVVSGGFAQSLEGLMMRRALDLLGLAFAAGAVHQGFDQAEAWVKKNRSRLGALVVACDASSGGRGKFLGLAPDAVVVDVFTAEALGEAIGRTDAVYMAVEQGGILRRFLNEADRLAGFRN